MLYGSGQQCALRAPQHVQRSRRAIVSKCDAWCEANRDRWELLEKRGRPG
jgi:uncharacterized protein YjiS (DUF1127 family)